MQTHVEVVHTGENVYTSHKGITAGPIQQTFFINAILAICCWRERVELSLNPRREGNEQNSSSFGNSCLSITLLNSKYYYPVNRACKGLAP